MHPVVYRGLGSQWLAFYDTGLVSAYIRCVVNRLELGSVILVLHFSPVGVMCSILVHPSHLSLSLYNIPVLNSVTHLKRYVCHLCVSGRQVTDV